MREVDTNKEKYCGKCDTVKPLSDFRRRDSENKLYYRCKTCEHAYKSAYNKNHPELFRKWSQGKRRERKFNVSHEEYMDMFSRQGGLCALCRRPERVKKKNGEVRSLAVDHDHETGRVRGLLCFKCNTSLGVLEKLPIIDYLNPKPKSHKKGNS